MSVLRYTKNYAIALPHRIEQIMSEMASQKLEIEIFPAIDMREKPTPSNWLAKPNDFGASSSWVAVLDHAINQQDEIFAVFEDDFVFRPDVLASAPDLAELEACPFEVVYMTGHYVKGGTRIEPRRIPFSPHLVRASGIHTLPARIFRREYAKFLRDRLKYDIETHGYGADRTDSILQVERKRTYAFEAHIGGQRSADFRSWEPRVFDISVQGAATNLASFPSDIEEPIIEQVRATIALASRRKRIAAINCSVRTIGCLAEGLTATSGQVTAFNDDSEMKAFLESGSDRLHRYRGYGSLEFQALKNIADHGPFDCVYIEMRRGVDDAKALAIYKMVESQLERNSLIMASPRTIDDRGWMKEVRTRRTFRSYGSLLFFIAS